MTSSAQPTETNSFPDLIELDALRMTVIVDNEVDHMSSAPKEIGQTSSAMRLYKDRRNLDKEKSTVSSAEPSGHVHGHDQGHDSQTEKGTGTKDGVEHRVLFDTGPQSAIFLENAKRLEIEFEKIEVIVLSHWHIDHSGGMMAAVDRCREARRQGEDLPPVIADLHPDRPDQRGACLSKPSSSGEGPDILDYVAWGRDPSFQGLKEAGVEVSLNDKAHTICDGFFGISGTIPRNTSYETGIPNHVRWSEKNKSWGSEPHIMDERYLVARVKSKGIVVLTGCSHAGVINVCQDVERAFQGCDKSNDGKSNADIFFVVGGFHLAGASVETRIKDTVQDMKKINPSFMAPGHCSGWRAKSALEQAMPGKVISLGVGSDFLIAKQES
ncbi:hypothetical protein BG011_001120 [Mortierella polycephala]|uniref:Metallo-beta-lactamase domain-containing protein n=1 Tax=Mortierella polycephala TaxID=41804 RepID=A0A9P6PH23_9FUNG|nr:hypothetical protein BG011_001120 [Mortierella polycephala]